MGEKGTISDLGTARDAGQMRARVKTLTPSGIGPFGPIFNGFRGNAQGAIAHLRDIKAGEAPGALYHPRIGDIDLVWGKEGTVAKDYSDGYGLAKIVKKHPEVVDDLQEIIETMGIRSWSGNRIMLESANHNAAVRLEWNGLSKRWLMSAYKNQ